MGNMGGSCRHMSVVKGYIWAVITRFVCEVMGYMRVFMGRNSE
jgi:hypothetical protein